MMIDDALRGERAQPGQQSPFRPKDDLVKRAILRMQQNLEMPLSVEALARKMEVGRRTLERRFLADLGQTPLKVYHDLRIDRALFKLRTTDDTVADIALATGFCDGTHLARSLKSERGLSPTEYRKANVRPVEDLPAVGLLLNSQE